MTGGAEQKASEEGDGRGSEETRETATRETDAVDRADYDPSYDPNAPVHCEVCGAEMYYTASCKLRCPRCGYTRDCSDP